MVAVILTKTGNQKHGLLKEFHRYGEARVASIILAPDKAYTSAITEMTTKDLGAAAVKYGPMMAVQSNDEKITLVPGGIPLFDGGRIAGGVGVCGGTEEQNCEIAEHMAATFNDLEMQEDYLAKN